MLRRRRAEGGDAPEPAGAEPVAGEPATDRMGAGAAPEQQPVLDADGELVPTPTFIQEIIALHPMAYATVSARMIAGSGSLTLCLILHCAYLLLRSYPDEDDAMTASPLLRIACTCRVIAAIPRPYAWWRIYSLHNEARKQTSSLRVAQRCLAASKDRPAAG